MNRFKKRTIALVLASVVTVVGAFGAENYKNSLMGIKFESPNSSDVNMVIQTKTSFNGNVTPIKKDANTYVLMLPEMNSLAPTPDLKNSGGNIVSVNIRTMPYSNTAKGYTRITIKTSSQSFNLIAQNQVYLPSNEDRTKQLESIQTETLRQKEMAQREANEKRQKLLAQRAEARKRELEEQKRILIEKREQERVAIEEANEKAVKEQIEVEQINDYSSHTKTPAASDSNNYYLGLLALLVVLCSAYFYVRAKNKMQELAGESFKIDTEEEIKISPTRKSLKQIKNTIKTLDETYSKAATIINNAEYTHNIITQKESKKVDDYEIVDLDKLFNEHKAKNSVDAKEQEENDALEEFLSGFSFIESEGENNLDEQQDLYSYDSEFYEEVLNKNDLKFSAKDLNCINELLTLEIQDETIKNINDYAVSNPIKPKKTKDSILEDLILSYSVSQKIVFTNDDIKILRNLINVELDNDFVTDLRTSSTRVAEMQQEIISSTDKIKKRSEITTLNVKDMLPDLSLALKAQSGKSIESNYKAETIFYSEGYDVQTLSLDDNLPDLSMEINKKENYTQKASASYEIVDKSYVVGTGELKISTELPDLQDVMANPEKYAKEEPKEIKVDEESLLNNILNVEFKPFYDGTNEFEVLNKLEDIPTISDVQEEFRQFANFEIEETEKLEEKNIDNEYDDFKELFDNEVIKLNSEDSIEKEVVELENKVDSVKKDVAQNKSVKTASDLLKKIEATKLERNNRKNQLNNEEIFKKKKEANESARTNNNIKCMFEGETLIVVSSVNMKENMGCHLAKGANGYVVLGYVGDRFFKINAYKELKSEKIQARQSEVLSNGDLRFIVRIGLNKFVVDVSDDNISYVMDLC